MKTLLVLLAAAAAWLLPAAAAQSPADQKRIEELRVKRDRGEPLTDDDRAFIQRMMALRGNAGEAQKGAPKQVNPVRAAQNAKWIKEHPPRESTGMVPLTDLGRGLYKGEQGGLYPGGENVPPPAHLAAGLRMASQIRPLNREGKPSPEGKIVLMSVGVSNTTMEFQNFQKMAAADKSLNPRLVLVDGAQPGQAADQAANPRSRYWQVADQRMESAGVTHAQIQALWIKETYPLYDGQLPFPGEARKLYGWLRDILHTAKARFPNLKIAYLSSRIYAGYALSAANPEPFAYEFGFSNKWVIADQIAGKPELNYDPAKGPVRAPWIAWGPYLWADGVKARSDGLVWLREELGQDGMHPSNAGRDKVARLLLEFLKTDATAKPWFLAAARDAAGGQAPPQRPSPQQLEERRKQYMRANPPRASVGLVPLTDLGTGAYRGEEGGLYPGGRNTAPPRHVQAGLRLAGEIAPLDQQGRKSEDGKIVLLSIGFSNPAIEFPGFQKRVAADPDVNPRLVAVNGCVGSRASKEQADPGSRYWKEVEQRLNNAGVTALQVQALWIKEVIPGAVGFPEMARQLANDLTATLHVVHDRFPNAKLAYLSSRTYGGYTELGGSPEPGAYETGFSVKWVVAAQLAGKPELNFDAARGPVRSPWIAWGPYLWTDGERGRKDGFVYLREDLRDDGLHPSDRGTAKIADLMLTFFKTDPAARPWFLK
ncbi:MAG: hypothetical protein ACE15B_15695 [Bryobacteraceae bacterium]